MDSVPYVRLYVAGYQLRAGVSEWVSDRGNSVLLFQTGESTAGSYDQPFLF